MSVLLNSSPLASAVSSTYYEDNPDPMMEEEEMDSNTSKRSKQILNRKYSCSNCDSAFHTLTNLQNHNIAIHQKIKPYSCEHCSFTCARMDNLNSHIKHKHEEKSLRCDQCKYGTNYAKELKRHVDSVHAFSSTKNRDGFECSECNYVATRKDAFTKHMSVSHNTPTTKVERQSIKEEYISNWHSNNLKIKEDHTFNAGDKECKISDVGNGMRTYICDTCDSRYLVPKEILEYVKCKKCFVNTNARSEKFVSVDIKRPSKMKTETMMHRDQYKGMQEGNENNRTEKDSYKCDNCPKTFTRRDHKKRHEENGVCKKQKISTKLEEVKMKNPLLSSELEDEEDSEQKAIIQCDHCELSCLGVDSFLVHLKDFHPDLYREEAIQEDEIAMEPLDHVQMEESYSDGDS